MEPNGVLESADVDETSRPPQSSKQNNNTNKRSVNKQEMDIYKSRLDLLAQDATRDQVSFPATLSSADRKSLHTYAHNLGLDSRSVGRGANRFLTVFRKTSEPFIRNPDSKVTHTRISDDSIKLIAKYLAKNPVTDSEKINSVVKENCRTGDEVHMPFVFGDTRTRLRLTVPPHVRNTAYNEIRQSLPIFDYRDEILNVIDNHQVCVISGETGSGKTTQVPQYILENSTANGQECRIICTQPRRLAATSIAARVAEERHDSVGNTVGYQIRLDSRVKATTNLIFTTSGYLLRCLTGSKNKDIYKNVTHLILDEVHEREKVTDFLLIAIRDILKEHPHLKVILMSATIDSDMFSDYFDKCPVINVPGRMFDVKVYHLAEILTMLNYKTGGMAKYMYENKGPKVLRTGKGAGKVVEIDDIESTDDEITDTSSDDGQHIEFDPEVDDPDDPFFEILRQQFGDKAGEPFNDAEPESEANEDMEFFDECLNECADSKTDSCFEQIFYLISDENMPVDYKHSQTGRTALSIAAERGLLLTTEMLLFQGAKPNLPDINGRTAFDYAKANDHMDCVGLMQRLTDLETVTEPMTKQEAATAKKDEDDVLLAKALQDFTLAAYVSSLKYPNDIDHQLLFHVISYLHRETSRSGSILVFLPGIDDIIMQKDMIEMKLVDADFELFVLHSGVNGTNAYEQNRIFDEMPPGIRKIILSTNIAETSITINDVVHVIDLGKVKQQTYDAIGSSTCLTSTAISKACAKQRMGRAGRIQNGFCYRLYSLEHHESMEMYTLPEILRVPLTEICLNARLLANADVSIEQFLSKALQPPLSNNIRQAVNLLQQIDALDPNERITHLGIHLANMPVDCQLGKSIMYAVLMQCLDPVITIVSAQSVKDPFLLPVGEDAAEIIAIKKEFSDNSLSDHYMLLNAFDQWRAKKNKGWEFCRDKMISGLNMQMIAGVRRLILGHLQMTGILREDSEMHSSRYLNRNKDRWDIIKACLTAGSYPNICRVQPLTGKLVSKQDKKLYPHKSSILCVRKSRNQIDERIQQVQADWLIHGEKSRVSSFSLIRSITPVPSIDLVLFAGPISLSEAHVIEDNGDGKKANGAHKHADIAEKIGNWNFEIDEWKNPSKNDDDDNDDIDINLIPDMDALDLNGEAIFIIDDWIRFSMRTKEARLLLQLRQKFAAILIKFLKNPSQFKMIHPDGSVLNLIFDIIRQEDLIERRLKKQSETEEDGAHAHCSTTNTHQLPLTAQWPQYVDGVASLQTNAYLNAIQPEHRRRLKQQSRTPKQKLHLKKNAQKAQQPNINWRLRPDGPQIQSSALTELPSMPSNAPFDHLPAVLPLRRYSKSEHRFEYVNDVSMQTPKPKERYFVLIIANMHLLTQTVNDGVWKFKMPVKDLLALKDASPKSKIIVFFYSMKPTAAIWGAGELHRKKKNGIPSLKKGDFNLVQLPKRSALKFITTMDISMDCELDEETGRNLYQKLCTETMEMP